MSRYIDWESTAFWQSLARNIGLFGASIGALVLLGWLLDIPLLKSMSPDWVAMKANTAMGLAFSGLALWLKARDAQPEMFRQGMGQLLSGMVILLGVFTLLEYLLELDFGIDQWLFQEPPDAIGTLAPGRMAPASALCFVLLGSALLLRGQTIRNRPLIAALAIATILLALAASLIHLYDTDNFQGLERLIQLAVHTVLAFMALGMGVLCSQPEHGIVALLRRRDSGGAIARRLLPLTLILPPLIGWLKLTGEREGLYTPDFGVALVALTYVVIFSALVVWSARFLSRFDAERELANAAIVANKTRLRTLLGAIPDMIWMKDPDGLYRFCNTAFERFFGIREADTLGKTDYDLVSREQADFFRANDQAAIAAGGPCVNEEWLTFPSGERILAETTKAPMFDPQGKLQGVLGIARDITAHYRATEQLQLAKTETERLLAEANRSRQALLSALEDSEIATRALRQNEVALRAEQARYVALFAAIADAVYVHEILEDGGPGRILEVNAVACRMTGYSREELLGMSPSQLDAPDSGADLGPVIYELTHGKSATFEQVHLSKSGQRIPVEIHSHLLTLNERPAVISIVRDITGRKQAETALRDSERHFRSLFENMLDGYAYCRMQFREGKAVDFVYIDVNESFETLTGLRDVVGKRVSEVIPGIRESNPELFEIYGRVALTGRSEAFETYVAGLGIWFSIAVYCPRPEHFVAVFDNITVRKAAEEKVLRLNEELEQRVQERTAQLTAANKELEAFSYSVSHDLRAPLRSISGFVELLKKRNYDAIDDKGRHYMEVIAEAAVQMGRLIDDILTFSRIGRAEISFGKVDLNQLLAEVRNTLRPQSEGRQVEWRLAPLPEVAGERSMLSLVLLNLVANALKFTQTREVAIIEVGAIAGDSEETVCYVRDNGVGFDMRHVDKLFGLFQRLHTQDQFEGTGVGLANVQRIVQRHGGRVWAEGRVNEGATFYFALPRPKAAHDDTPAVNLKQAH